MFYVGIDVHKEESQICILEEDKQVRQLRIKTSRQRLEAVFGQMERSRLLLESSTESEWVARCLESLGHEVIVADPNFAAMYATRSRRVKTDQRDAQTLAEACRLGAYRVAHRVSDERRALRVELSVREVLVETRTKYISQVRALLRRDGIRVASGSAECFVQRLDKVSVPEPLRAQLEPVVAVLRALEEQIRAAERALEASVEQDEDTTRLRTMPHIGPVTAAAFVAAVDEASRFEGPHQVESYLGLVPSEYSSGEKQRRGRITKAGSSRVRRLLVQAALSMMRVRKASTMRLWSWAERIMTRRGKRIAMVALARRLAGILYAMMRDKSEYRPLPELADTT